MAVLLVDTVGFVSRLPHNLVEAFKSTLEEAAWSDVIVRVADAGDEQREEQLAVTDEVLDGLDCADIPRLTVYNKCDKPGALSFDPDILLTSAKTGYGPVSYTHLRAHETDSYLVCRLLLEKKKKPKTNTGYQTYHQNNRPSKQYNNK